MAKLYSIQKMANSTNIGLVSFLGTFTWQAMEIEELSRETLEKAGQVGHWLTRKHASLTHAPVGQAPRDAAEFWPWGQGL